MSRRHTAQAVAVAVLAAVTLAACGDAGDTDTAATDVADTDAAVPFGLVDPATAASLAQDDAITVIDVRTPEEYAEGHIDGATLLDFYEPTFADQLAELDRDGTYLLYCRSGNRSGQAASIMSELGFDQVYDAQGGVIAYEAAGLPLEN